MYIVLPRVGPENTYMYIQHEGGTSSMTYGSRSLSIDNTVPEI